MRPITWSVTDDPSWHRYSGRRDLSSRCFLLDEELTHTAIKRWFQLNLLHCVSQQWIFKSYDRCGMYVVHARSCLSYWSRTIVLIHCNGITASFCNTRRSVAWSHIIYHHCGCTFHERQRLHLSIYSLPWFPFQVWVWGDKLRPRFFPRHRPADG